MRHMFPLLRLVRVVLLVTCTNSLPKNSICYVLLALKNLQLPTHYVHSAFAMPAANVLRFAVSSGFHAATRRCMLGGGNGVSNFAVLPSTLRFRGASVHGSGRFLHASAVSCAAGRKGTFPKAKKGQEYYEDDLIDLTPNDRSGRPQARTSASERAQSGAFANKARRQPNTASFIPKAKYDDFVDDYDDDVFDLDNAPRRDKRGKTPTTFRPGMVIKADKKVAASKPMASKQPSRQDLSSTVATRPVWASRPSPPKPQGARLPAPSAIASTPRKPSLSRSATTTTTSVDPEEKLDARVTFKARTDKVRKSPTSEYLYGFAPVTTALQAKQRRLTRLFLEDRTPQNEHTLARVQTLVELANQAKVEISRVPREALQSFMENKNRPHQGVILRCSPREYIPFTSEIFGQPTSESVSGPSSGTVPIEDKPASSTSSTSYGAVGSVRKPIDHVWIALDEVHDPMNLGAIVRSCYFFGIQRIVVCKKNTCPITPTVSKASSGAAELMSIYSVENMEDFLTTARDRGFDITGTCAPQEKPAQPLVNSQEWTVTKPTILLMGNEGYGVRSALKNLCTSFVTIPPSQTVHVSEYVDSLNVSVATGALLHHLSRPLSK